MASLFIRFPQGQTKAFTLSYDDGLQSDDRLIGLLRSRGMRATFNIGARMLAPEGHVYPQGTAMRHHTPSSRPHAYDGMEVALHGMTHPYLERLPAAVCTREILGDRLALEEEFGGIVRGMAYPFGTFSPQVLQILRDCGVQYARTARSTHGFALPADWLLLDPTCHHDDPQLFDLARRFVEDDPCRNVDRGPWMFYVWGHTYELEEKGNWDRVEQLLDAVAGRDDVWYASNGDICSYVEDFGRLVFSADGHRVYNPCAQTIWLEYDCRPTCVPAGQLCELP